MEIKIKPLTLTIRGMSGEFNNGQSCDIQLQIVRGPFNFNSANQHVTSEDRNVQFLNEEFKKNSGFYFTKDGAEYKKAAINIVKKTLGGVDQVLATTDINLSSLIS